MRKILKFLFALLMMLFIKTPSYSQTDSVKTKRQDYQIALPHPAKSIRVLMYEKNFAPIQGVLSEDKKFIIIKNYETGSKVHVKVEYEDGTLDEFVKSPCYIDPVITELFLDLTKQIEIFS